MPARRSSTLLVGVLIAGLSVAACGGTPTATVTPSVAPSVPAAETPATSPSSEATAEPTETPSAAETEEASQPSAGGGRIEIDGEQVAITVPDDWTQVVLTADDLDTILGGFAEGTFSAEQIAQMKAAVGSGMKLMAFDGDGSGTNLNLLVQPTPIPMSMLKPAIAAQLEAVPGTSGVKVEEREIDGEEAIMVTYGLDQTMADGSAVKMSGNQLYASANGRLYVFTLTLSDGSSVDADDVFNTIEFLD